MFMYLAVTIVHCQSTANNQSELIISTRVKEVAEGLSNRRISVANFDSDNRSLLEHLMAVVNEIRQRQLLQEQERQLGKLLEVKQLEMLLRQQQSNNDQLESVVRSIVDDLKHNHQLAFNQSVQQADYHRQQVQTQRALHQEQELQDAALMAAINSPII